MKSLLIGTPQTTWREWLRTERGARDLLVLDPSDPNLGVPGRVALYRGSRPIWTRFYGGLDPQRAPHVLIGALSVALARASDDLLVQLFPYRPSPVLRQTLHLAAEVLRPDEILVPAEIPLDLDGFNVGPQAIEVEAAFPEMVQKAQRKAQWMKLLENAESHEFELERVTLDGARLGAGNPLSAAERTKAGLEQTLHVEANGPVLLVIAEEDFDEARIGRALDITGCQRAQLVAPDAYDGLLCCLTRGDGEELGMGRVESVDWASRRIYIQSTAVPPAPARTIRLGFLRIDSGGNELEEVRAWHQ